MFNFFVWVNFSNQQKFSFFFVRFPNVVCSKLFGILQFNKLIESAPFYTRISSGEQKILVPENNQSDKELCDKTATLEVLVPRRISSDLNQILMSARQFKITGMIRGAVCLRRIYLSLKYAKQ